MKKENVDLLVAILLIIIGMVLMVLPHTSNDNVRSIIICVMSLYIILNFGRYFLTFKAKDYEGLHTALVSIVVAVICVILKIEQAKYLALAVLIWITLMALVKLKKADYFHDCHNKLWILEIFNLGLFILVGILTSINFYYNSQVQILILGYFFLINGILEVIEPLIIKLNIKEKK